MSIFWSNLSLSISDSGSYVSPETPTLIFSVSSDIVASWGGSSKSSGDSRSEEQGGPVFEDECRPPSNMLA